MKLNVAPGSCLNLVDGVSAKTDAHSLGSIPCRWRSPGQRSIRDRRLQLGAAGLAVSRLGRGHSFVTQIWALIAVVLSDTRVIDPEVHRVELDGASN